MMMTMTKSFLLIQLLAPLMVAPVLSAAVRSHAVEFSNDSGHHIHVDWYNPSTGDKMSFAELDDGESLDVNSFTNHTFILTVANGKNKTCSNQQEGVCRSATVTISDKQNQRILIHNDLNVEHRDSNTDAKYTVADIVEECKRVAKEDPVDGYDQKDVMEEMLECIEDATAKTIQNMRDELAFESRLRESISAKVENFTCADPNMQTSEAIEKTQWTYNSETRNVHILHERKDSKIHMIEQFISEEECAAIEEAAAPLLHRGTVADGKGGSKLSDHRKAMQAGIKVPWEKEADGDPIARVVRRLYAYSNHATGFGLKVEGQEDLMAIHYAGRGEKDTAPDQYRPHCDGDCNSLKHKPGGRVATMVMYCNTTNLRGGGTNFNNANVFVKPKVGAAAFFSYLHPDKHIHESGFTSHSGCPVVEGVKHIAVHWMRIGVSEDRPWDSFNTLNVHKSECDDDDFE